MQAQRKTGQLESIAQKIVEVLFDATDDSGLEIATLYHDYAVRYPQTIKIMKLQNKFFCTLFYGLEELYESLQEPVAHE